MKANKKWLAAGVVVVAAVFGAMAYAFRGEIALALMERTLEQLAEALEQRPTTAVRMLDVLPAAERTLLLETWNATEASYPSEQCIHQLFEEQVARTPDAIAVVQGEVALTYAALNAQAASGRKARAHGLITGGKLGRLGR